MSMGIEVGMGGVDVVLMDGLHGRKSKEDNLLSLLPHQVMLFINLYHVVYVHIDYYKFNHNQIPFVRFFFIFPQKSRLIVDHFFKRLNHLSDNVEYSDNY